MARVVQVHRKGFRVPVKAVEPTPEPEPDTVFSGKITKVELARPAYAPGEEVKLMISYWVERDRGWAPTWASSLEAFNIGISPPKLLDKYEVHHWGLGYDKEYKNPTLTFKQVAGGIRGLLRLSCHGSRMVEVDRASFGVPVAAPVVNRVPVTRPDEVKPGLGLGLLVLGGLVLFALAKKEE